VKGPPGLKGMKGMKGMGKGAPAKQGRGVSGGNMSGLAAGLMQGPRSPKAGRVSAMKDKLFGKGGM
jgi:hypothetical protein